MKIRHLENKKSQIDKFRRAARELECDESSDALDKCLDRLDLKSEKKSSEKDKRSTTD